MKPNPRVTPSVRLFDNPILELLSKAHPALPISLWGPVCLLSFIYGGVVLARVTTRPWSWLLLCGVFMVGIVIWSLFEYLLHRYFFHFKPKSERIRRLHYYVHEVHHDHPQDRYRLLAPPLMSVSLAVLFFLVFYLLLGPVWVWGFFSGFVAGYLWYDYTHYYVHFALPKCSIGQRLRIRHLQHHYAWTNRWYGVSSPLWDYVFKTSVPSGIRPANTRYSKRDLSD